MKRRVSIFRVLFQGLYPTEEEADYYGNNWKAHCAIQDAVLRVIKIFAPLIVIMAIAGVSVGLVVHGINLVLTVLFIRLDFYLFIRYADYIPAKYRYKAVILGVLLAAAFIYAVAVSCALYQLLPE